MQDPPSSASKRLSFAPEKEKNALKILEKYCKRRYGGLFEGGQSPLAEPAPRKKSKVSTHLWKIVKTLYERLGIKYILLIGLLAAYGLLGGLIFNRLEQPHELEMIEKNKNDSYTRWVNYGNNITAIIKNCTGGSEDCENNIKIKIQELLEKYDKETGLAKKTKLPVWDWDYWNSVFYAGTIFTTIGYGNMFCKTLNGRIATIIYAIIGIPLMLMVLDKLGNLLFHGAANVWSRLRKCVRFVLRKLRRLGRKKEVENEVKWRRGPDRVDQTSIEENLEESFPLLLALTIVFLYTFGCAALFQFWETQWDYFTAFYFFFVSLTTVGLGDEVPNNPHYATAAFFFFIVGLALVSMCVSVMHARFEAKYMVALHLIENEIAEQAPPSLTLPNTPVKSGIDFRLSRSSTSSFRRPAVLGILMGMHGQADGRQSMVSDTSQDEEEMAIRTPLSDRPETILEQSSSIEKEAEA